MKTGVILTTYNRPDALRATLEGYAAQDTHDFELIVADDGSTGETRALVAQYAARAPFALRHVWQEDRGFRAGAARNRALAAILLDHRSSLACRTVVRHDELEVPRVLYAVAFKHGPQRIGPIVGRENDRRFHRGLVSIMSFT